VVTTDRLNILPLTYSQLKDYLLAGNILENKLGLTITGRTISEEVKEMVDNFTLPNIRRSKTDAFLFYTFWIVIDRERNVIVAELGFKGEPNYRGEIEIGYGTMPAERGKGYMSEALFGMIEWAKARPDITGILAETARENLASIRIVQKNHFRLFDERGDMLWWRRIVV
jgi:ribosomal-protein-alanine N-acetyltransferase